MVDIRITYETLFDLLRREKNREELQSLDKDFYEQVLAYLKEKKEALSRKGDELFVSAEREKLKIQFQNIRRIIKELYERREKKIINMAVSRVRTGSDVIDTSNLLPSEKEFFEEQAELFSKYKEKVLNTILHLKEFENSREEEKEETTEPKKSSEPALKQQKPEIKEEKEEAEGESKEEPDEVEKEEVKEEVKESEVKESLEPADAGGIKKVKITSSLPEFVGTQGEVIGPFEEGDEVELEVQIADILVNKGTAELVDN